MVTILLTALKVIPLTIIIVFIVQLLRLAFFANRNDTSSPSMISSIVLVLTMPFSTEGRVSGWGFITYYGELITGIMYTKYKSHVTSTIGAVNEVKAVDPEVRRYIISSFTIDIISYNLTHSTDFAMFSRVTQNSAFFLTTLLNKDVAKIMHYGLNDRERPFEPYVHKLLARVNETARINNISTNAVILVSIEYLSRLDLKSLYDSNIKVSHSKDTID